ncbi:hypothetical protein FGO68_gene9944 [Halteria grandinella]|uniref:Uncharacterized protein n=1 Tax=Halteria grandinella TaxID=5974 RepID=A0A8J8P178_HALGN|nr:hypothetical protein FGO68_gene9944 [Halteria grandinella]
MIRGGAGFLASLQPLPLTSSALEGDRGINSDRLKIVSAARMASQGEIATHLLEKWEGNKRNKETNEERASLGLTLERGTNMLLRDLRRTYSNIC